MKTKLAFLMLLIVGLLSLMNVNAVSPDYDIEKVEVEDRLVSTADTNYVVAERGETIEVAVWVIGQQTGGSVVDNVRVKAWVGGYEYGEVAEKSNAFKIEPSGTYKKSLFVEIPNDIDADNNGNSEGYTLHVEVYDKNYSERTEYKLKIDEKRHDLRVQDIIFNPSRSVDAGERLFMTVRVENMGDKREEDVQVKISIPELGVEARDYIDKLTPEQQQEKNDDVENTNEIVLMLPIPKTAKTGDYKAKLDIIYSRGHEVITEEYTIHVEGTAPIATAPEETIISVDSIEKQVEAGKEIIYKFMLANFGETKKVYSAEVLGVGTWGSASVEPGFITVNGGETGELYIRVKANEDISGRNPFTVKIKESGKVLKEINLATEVKETIPKAREWKNLKEGLEIGFVILAILLVIIGLIIAFTRLRKGREEEPELGREQQTYY